MIQLYVMQQQKSVLLNLDRGNIMKKKKYVKPIVETETILERVALACSKVTESGGCDPRGLSTSGEV